MPFSENDFDELEALARAASQEPWQWGHSATETHEDAIKWATETIAASDATDLHMVYYGNPEIEGDTRVVAYTGNGPTSEANARYLQAAQPAHVLAMLEMLRGARREHARLLRRLQRLEKGK
jgi:hypothetical protein